MGISISGSNAISGLGGSDTNFDKVLEQLKEIESTNINRLEAWKSDWKLRYEAFTQIIEQIQAASSMLSQLSDKNSFVSKLVQRPKCLSKGSVWVPEWRLKFSRTKISVDL